MKRLCFVVLLFALLAFPTNVNADVAPPIYPPGSNLQPGAEVTQVRMVAETVVIEVQRDTTPGGLGRARVTADFNMRNLGIADESMAVRFPISGNDGRDAYPEIGNLVIWVDGKGVQYRRASYPSIQYWTDEDVPWAEFDVTFPSGQDVPIRVTYDLEGSGYYPYTAFYYILETGAGWKDTIGSADVILRLPYEASPQNVIMDLEIGWATTTPGAVFQGNEARWHFTNFEPGQNQPVQNMEFALVAPAAWQNVLAARENVKKYPSDGETWGMLAKAYKQAFQMSKGYREDAGGEELYRLSVEAYEKCLSLKPKDAQWHAGFADLLADRAMWDSWSKGTTPDTIRALDEIHTALQLAPNDPIVREIAENMTYMFPEGMERNENGFDFPWLTQTPTALPPSPTPTLVFTPETSAAQTQPGIASVETATVAAQPVLADTPQAGPNPGDTNPAPQRSFPFCGSAAFAPLILMFWFLKKRR
jgi:tetratricopeptide (TPR) repeat protein